MSLYVYLYSYTKQRTELQLLIGPGKVYSYFWVGYSNTPKRKRPEKKITPVIKFFFLKPKLKVRVGRLLLSPLRGVQPHVYIYISAIKIKHWRGKGLNNWVFENQPIASEILTQPSCKSRKQLASRCKRSKTVGSRQLSDYSSLSMYLFFST